MDMLTRGYYFTCVIHTTAYSSTYQIDKNAFLLQHVIYSFICISFEDSKLMHDYYISVQATFGPGIVNSPLSSMYGKWGVLAACEENLQKPYTESKQHVFA
jgi:hypothetical protein